MKIPLAAMVKRKTNARRKSITFPPIATTGVQASELANLYVAIVRIWNDAARDKILPAYQVTLDQNDAMRDSVSDIDIAVAVTEQNAVQAIFNFTQLFTNWSWSLQLWHMRKIISQVRYATDVDLETLIGPADERLTVAQALARNVALVRNVSDELRGKIADAVFRGLQARTPLRDVAKEISIATGLARARSLRIASDQTVKLSAAFDQDRQEQLGMTEFEWRHSGKVHFRPEHKARNGKQFRWDSEIGKKDPPGRAPFCGCKAKAVLNLEDD